MDTKDFILQMTNAYSAGSLHDFSIDIEKIENTPMAHHILDRFLSMGEGDSTVIKILLLNTLIDNGVIKPARLMVIDSILKEI